MTTEEAILQLAECVSRDFGSKAKIFSITVNKELYDVLQYNLIKTRKYHSLTWDEEGLIELHTASGSIRIEKKKCKECGHDI